MGKTTVQPGTVRAEEKFRITILDDGPYLVYGKPPLAQVFTIKNPEGEIWNFQNGTSYPMENEPAAICRCGASANKPFCDGSHMDSSWDARVTASTDEEMLSGAELMQGQTISLSDNEKYCAFARFCDGKGRVWNLVGQSDSKEARETVIREANHCPAGRLSAWDNETQKPFELKLDPSLGLLEDPSIHVSAGLWVRGGIPIEREDGRTFEIRNRVTLCRCGASYNKPFCDGNHVSAKFHDGLKGEPAGEKY